jgi:hypothetical protein
MIRVGATLARRAKTLWFKVRPVGVESLLLSTLT